MPSPDTIWRRVKTHGKKLSQFLSDRITGTEADTVILDGTKCHSQDDDRAQHEAQPTLAEDDKRSRSTVMVSDEPVGRIFVSATELMCCLEDRR